MPTRSGEPSVQRTGKPDPHTAGQFEVKRQGRMKQRGAPSGVPLLFFEFRSEAARPVTGTGANPVLPRGIRHDLDVDLAESLIRVGSGVIGQSIRIADILTDRIERLHLLLPASGPVGFASGAGSDAAENAA